MINMDEFIKRRFREMTGIADGGDIVLLTMERSSPYFIKMAIALEESHGGMIEVGHLTRNSYMVSSEFITKESTILVRQAALPTVISQFVRRENEIKYIMWRTGGNCFEERTDNYQYLLRNSNIPSQEQAKRIIGLPSGY